MATRTGGLIGAPAVAPVGEAVKAIFAGTGGASMLNAGLVTAVSASDEAVRAYPAPVLSIDRSANVATPLIALTVVVPERVPPAVLAPRVTVTALVARVTVFLKAS